MINAIIQKQYQMVASLSVTLPLTHRLNYVSLRILTAIHSPSLIKNIIHLIPAVWGDINGPDLIE